MKEKRKVGEVIFLIPNKFTESIEIKDNSIYVDGEKEMDFEYEVVKEIRINCAGNLHKFNVLEHLNKFKNIERIQIDVCPHSIDKLHLKDLEHLDYFSLRNSKYKSLDLIIENCGNKTTLYGNYGNIELNLSNIKGLTNLEFIDTRPVEITVYETDYFENLIIGKTLKFTYLNYNNSLDADFLVEVLERTKNGDYDGVKDCYDSGLFSFKMK